jgi:Uncharacterized protein SCO1/SenC/PrrC, involved in biogenesis of respiratory and photosynthetic systems|nr:SCO family protein [uncultured Steroidobacter sp.]
MSVLAGFVSVYLCMAASSSLGAAPARMASLQVPGYALPQPLALQPFGLIDQHGREFTLEDLRNRWTLLFFGYTHCPDVCPTTLAQLRSVTKQLSKHPDAVIPAVVFVSIDPQRDSTQQLKQYSTQYGTDFTGVGGEPGALDSFARQFRAKYARAGGTSTSYFIDHTSSVALIDPNAQLRVLFSVPLRPDAVAIEIQRLTKSARTGR